MLDSCHRRYCTQKPVNCKETGYEWASQPTRMTLDKGHDSEPLTDHELLKPSRLAVVIVGLVMRNEILAAVLESLVKQRKGFKSNNDAFFDKTRLSDTYKGSLFCENLQSAAQAT